MSGYRLPFFPSFWWSRWLKHDQESPDGIAVLRSFWMGNTLAQALSLAPGQLSCLPRTSSQHLDLGKDSRLSCKYFSNSQFVHLLENLHLLLPSPAGTSEECWGCGHLPAAPASSWSCTNQTPQDSSSPAWSFDTTMPRSPSWWPKAFSAKSKSVGAPLGLFSQAFIFSFMAWNTSWAVIQLQHQLLICETSGDFHLSPSYIQAGYSDPTSPKAKWTSNLYLEN